MKTVLPVCVAFLFVVADVSAQKTPPAPPTWRNDPENFVLYHQLKPEEFPINDKVHKDSGFWMEPGLRPSYQFYYHGGGLVYAYISNWQIISGVDMKEMSRKSGLRDIKAELPYAQAVLDIYEVHARELNQLKTGDLPSGSGPDVAAAQRDLEGKLRVFLESKHDEIQREMDELARKTDKGRNRAKVRELALAIKKRLDALPVATLVSPPTLSATPPATATAVPSVSASPK
jgi:hypothetical protein